MFSSIQSKWTLLRQIKRHKNQLLNSLSIIFITVGIMFPFDKHKLRSHYYKSWLSQKSTKHKCLWVSTLIIHSHNDYWWSTMTLRISSENGENSTEKECKRFIRDRVFGKGCKWGLNWNMKKSKVQEQEKGARHSWWKESHEQKHRGVSEDRGWRSVTVRWALGIHWHAHPLSDCDTTWYFNAVNILCLSTKIRPEVCFSPFITSKACQWN